MSDSARDTTSRGDATREALIEAAVELFGREGYHGASNRLLAETARVNPALIGYHFGSKRGLYLAVFEHIAEAMGRRMGPVAEEVETEIDAVDSRAEEPGTIARRSETLLSLLHRLLDQFVVTITSEESAAWARLIVREQQDPSEAFDIVYDGVMGRVLSLLSRLIAGLRGEAADSPTVRLTAVTLLGQAVVFRVARAAAMRQLGWDQIGPGEIAAIQERIRRNATAVLTATVDEEIRG